MGFLLKVPFVLSSRWSVLKEICTQPHCETDVFSASFKYNFLNTLHSSSSIYRRTKSCYHFAEVIAARKHGRNLNSQVLCFPGMMAHSQQVRIYRPWSMGDSGVSTPAGPPVPQHLRQTSHLTLPSDSSFPKITLPHTPASISYFLLPHLGRPPSPHLSFTFPSYWVNICYVSRVKEVTVI